jgi:hypothetical protein
MHFAVYLTFWLSVSFIASSQGACIHLSHLCRFPLGFSLLSSFIASLFYRLFPPTFDVGSWNVRDFGKLKVSNRKVLDVIAHVICNFHVISIQEISGGDDEVVQELINHVNRRCGKNRYSMRSSPIL